MKPLLRRYSLAMLSTGLLLVPMTGPSMAGEPTTSLHTEYLMTLHAPLDAPATIDDGLRVVNVPAGGWVDGPRIKGKLLSPSGDWLRTMPSGVSRLDVRATIQTDDGQLVFVSYNGVVKWEKEALDRFVKGETIKADECYFITAPTFETKSEKYGWLNAVQAVGKMVELKRGEGSHITYDIFAMK